MFRRVLPLLVVLLALSACRLAGGAPPNSQVAAPSASVLVGDGRCFGPEVPLEYAGRSTMAELGVQEAQGDPMSTHQADIYITRDKFHEGIHYGRLVCAIYVEDGGFIEYTVHPEDQSSPPPPPPTPTPLPSGLIQIFTHCGLDDPRIEYDGQLWRFDVEDQANTPDGWGSDFPVVQIRSGPDGPIVTGPDGSEWQLILADPNEEGVGGCL
jgi:hypothetical protein